MSEKQPIIIKKIKKGGHGGHHGGSWKIAYADFVTAMMAFFLLMWLLNSASQETKEQISIFFQEYSVLDGMPTAMGVGSGGTKTSVQERLRPIMVEGTIGQYEEGRSQRDQLKGELAEAIEKDLSEFRDEVTVDTIDNGVRIQMTETQGKPFFRSGSAIPTDNARRVLKVIADTIRDKTEDIAVEGHTDSIPLGGPNSRYTNWELSTDRASSARLLLAEFGIPAKRMLRVSGYADTQPLIKDNPADPRNRRVSILLLTKKPPKKPAEDASNVLPVAPARGLSHRPLSEGSDEIRPLH